MEAITLTINDQAISARAGKTILEVAREHGINIPTLCHHELLRPIGACRLCQVELVDRGVVVPACVTQIAPKMVIQTHSERVVRNRRNIVRLLMAAHPESCVVCEKGNRCELRSLAAKLGVGDHGLDPMPYHPGVQDLNPFLARDLSKCILCAKCIRADQEVVAEGVIDYNKRGFDAHPATLEDAPLADGGCTFCGTCLSVCPTGAIFEKHKPRLDHAGARTESVCGFCACGCSIYLEHDHTQVRGVAPTAREGTANGVSLCVKGHFGFDHLNSAERLTSPLVRTDEGFKPIGWDQALALAAKGLGEAAQAHGPGSVAIMGGGRSTNEENYLLQKLGRAVIGTPNLDSLAGAYARPAQAALLAATGFAAGTMALKDLAKSEVIVVMGADPTQTAPVAAYHLKRAVRAGAKLLLIDPLAGKLTKWASLWLRPAVGGDLALLTGLLKILVDEDLVDHKFVGVKTRDFAKLEAALAGQELEHLAAAAGVKVGQLKEAAGLVGRAGTAALMFGRGVMQQARAHDVVSLILDLLLATGNLGREGAGVIPIYTDCNTQGALDMGLDPEFLPGQRPAEDAGARAAAARLWGAEPPAGPGLGALEMVTAAADGALKAMLVVGANPAGELPDAAKVRAALGGLDCLVVADMFLSETARLAHLVLPVEGFAEKDGTYTNLERRVQRLKAAVPPPGGFPAAWQVIVRLAKDLGASWSYGSPAEVLAEIEQAAPLYRGMGGALSKGRQVPWPLPGVEDVTDTLPHAIGHPDGRASFLLPDLTGLARPVAAEGYPFLVMAGHLLPHLGGGLRTSQSRRLAMAAPEPTLGLSPADWQALGLAEGGEVVVRSPGGEIRLKAVSDQRLPAGVAFLPACHPGLGHNALLAHDWRAPAASPAAKTAWADIVKA